MSITIIVGGYIILRKIPRSSFELIDGVSYGRKLCLWINLAEAKGDTLRAGRSH